MEIIIILEININALAYLVFKDIMNNSNGKK